MTEPSQSGCVLQRFESIINSSCALEKIVIDNVGVFVGDKKSCNSSYCFHRLLYPRPADVIARYEKCLRFPLTDASRRMLLSVNGFELFCINVCMMGIANVNERRNVDSIKNVPLDIGTVNYARPIIGNNCQGNIVASLFENEVFVIDGRDGVFLYDQDLQVYYRCGLSLVEFLIDVSEIISAHFDKCGQLRETIIKSNVLSQLSCF